MNEIQWAQTVAEQVNAHLDDHYSNLIVVQSAALSYTSEILSYRGTVPVETNPITHETDLLLVEKFNSDSWIPRVVIECKINTITTHDAVTYSEKTFAHKRVHPYLRYGILLGNRKHYPLPGRLFRHGLHFDFMMSWVSYEATTIELHDLIEILEDELEASRCLQEMLYRSRSSARKRYVLLHKPLRLKSVETQSLSSDKYPHFDSTLLSQ